MRLTGLKAIVTGAEGAMGSVLVKKFLGEGVKVIGTIHAVQRPNNAGPVVYIPADVTDEGDVARLFRDAVSTLGGLDILVNTVGGYLPARPVVDLRVSDWDHMMNLNLRSVFLCTREALRVMRGSGYGRIVNFSAQAALHPAAGKSAYSVAKAAVSVFTEVVAKEVQRDGITINAIAPGIIDTAANRASMPGANYAEWVSPDDIAETICFLCSRGNPITGTTLRAFGRLA